MNDTTVPSPDSGQHQVWPATAGSSGFAMSKVAWTFGIGAALAGVGILLPWEQATSPFATVTQGPLDSGGGAAFLFALVAGVIALAWPSREETLTKGRLVGLSLVIATMTMLCLAKFAVVAADSKKAEAGSAVADLGTSFGVELSSVARIQVEPGFGLYLWTFGVTALWIGVVRAIRAKRPSQTERTVAPF